MNVMRQRFMGENLYYMQVIYSSSCQFSFYSHYIIIMMKLLHCFLLFPFVIKLAKVVRRTLMNFKMVNLDRILLVQKIIGVKCDTRRGQRYQIGKKYSHSNKIQIGCLRVHPDRISLVVEIIGFKYESERGQRDQSFQKTLTLSE